MIVVFDTNVYIAAVITEGVCSKLLHRARMAEFTLVICPFILDEVRRIFSKKLRLSTNEVNETIAILSEAIAETVEHQLKVRGVCRDADDDNVLACAMAAKASYLVTGDADLLEIGKYQGVEILTPRDFELRCC